VPPWCADCEFPALTAIDSMKAKPASMSPAAALSNALSPAPGTADVPEAASPGATAREGVAAVSADCAGVGAVAAATGMG
jgi:hypothetical protein